MDFIVIFLIWNNFQMKDKTISSPFIAILLL